MTRLKVLISAYACRPGMGSEPGVGWNFAKELARHHDVWVLTRSDNRPVIESELAQSAVHRLTFIYFDLPSASLWKRGLQGVHLHYYLWQIKAYFIARRLHQEIKLDLLHHVTYVRYSSPSFLALLPVPFLWGPVGGGESAPRAFWKDFPWRGKLYELLRNGMRYLGEWDPFVRLTAHRSCVAYATTEETARRLKIIGCKNISIFSQVGLTCEELKCLHHAPLPGDRMTRFISVGRYLHWKGFHLGLQAFARASLPPDAEYWIVGQGAEKQRLQALVTQLGIVSQVKFLQEMPRTELLQQLSTCFALIHPSLHESGGFVCLEAMAAGCPVVCLDLGGPGITVTPTAGFKVAADSPDQAIAEMAEALTRLVREPELRIKMGLAGQQHVNESYRWDRKVALLTQSYQEHAAFIDL